MQQKRIKQQEIDEVQRELMRNNVIKAELEDKILTLLQEQIADDKICKYMNKSIRDLRDRIKGLVSLYIIDDVSIVL